MTDTKFAIVTGPVRAGSTPVHIYNDGLAVFLFDVSNQGRIRDANPQAIWGIGPDTFADETTQALVRAGDWVLYGMLGDGGVDLEVVVGAPLSESELDGLAWHPPQRTLIRLPSGGLCVHSFNSLPMGDNDDEPEDEGAVVAVPPGEYVLTLHRKDWEATDERLGRDILDEADEAGIDVYDGERIDEVLVLTPVAQADPLTGPPDILFKDCLGG
jgi:hypothetical protein